MDNYKALFLIQQIYATIFSLTNKAQSNKRWWILWKADFDMSEDQDEMQTRALNEFEIIRTGR